MVFFLLYYEAILRFLGKYTSFFPLSDNDKLFVLWSGFILVSFVFILKVKLPYNKISQILSVTTLVLFVQPAFSSVQSAFRPDESFVQDQKVVDGLKQPNPANKEKPDIYYLIFDRYAGNSTLKDYYGFDNSDFTTYLEREKFFVAGDSTTNYQRTLHSLASSLNLSYIKPKDEKVSDVNGKNETFSQELLRNNQVFASLKNMGYKIYNIGNWWWPTRVFPVSDKSYISNKLGLRLEDFHRFLVVDTAFYRVLEKFFPQTASEIRPPGNHRQTILYSFGAVESTVSLAGPKLVFAHILIPHEPYVFDKNCHFIDKVDLDEIKKYVEQLQCANKKISSLVSKIREESPSSVIIVQADEGPHPMLSEVTNGVRGNEQETLREKFMILNAYYFPDQDYKDLYESITPINSFRVVFNKYFGTNLELLPDKNFYYYSRSKIYEFTDITEKLK